MDGCKYGSIISDAIQSKLSAKKDTSGGIDSSPQKKQKHGSFSFLGGMQTLTNALCNELSKDELKLQSKVLEIACSCSEKSPQDSWSISYESDDKRLSSEKCINSHNCARMGVYNLFPMNFFKAPLSAVKQLKITKGGNPFLLHFIPEVSYLPIDELKQIVTFDLRQLAIRCRGGNEPSFLNHYYWSKAFPFEYGNHKGGLSVGKAISSGCEAADLVISYLDSSSDAKEKSQ
ncbi:hypothetical protein SASPL_115217 [Salvia splendens]|uniref:Uncharacterized protein n=1 Tax=Salvia splendens TaxID=180675 RepID=A0A8X9A131_SALSN|nr:hypothetical protein SASPL_115217 [Salvia splendens]